MRFLRPDNRFEAERVVLEVLGFVVPKVGLDFVALEFPPKGRNRELVLVD